MARITILGAGLAGTLMSLFLARRGYDVDLFESRSDLRVSSADYGRSINLALSCRGITGLKAIGLMDKAEKIMVPMRARAIHEKRKEITYQPFGRHVNEYINAIQRNELNALLLDEADSSPNINIRFKLTLNKIDLEQKEMHFTGRDGQRFIHGYERLIGADGAASIVRETLQKEGIVEASREFLPHGYKELSISRKHTNNMVKEHLHLWPRKDFLLLGNPNKDHSITGSLFLANKGKDSFDSLDNEKDIIKFFKQEFSDAFYAMPNLVEEFIKHPVGHLSTIKTAPWFYKNECLLIGDAAHGIVPFFGQGMNSAFEDCRVLDILLDKYLDDWDKTIPEFYLQRKANTDAVAAMSMDNYREIQVDVTDDTFLLRKKIERELMRMYPDRYITKHIMVMFTNTPYAKAWQCGQEQDELLAEICKRYKDINDIDKQWIDKKIKEYEEKIHTILDK